MKYGVPDSLYDVFVALIRAPVEILETRMELLYDFLVTNEPHASSLCAVLLQLWPLPRRRGTPVADMPTMSEARYDAAVAWVDTSENNGSLDLLGPLRKEAPPEEAGRHVWAMVHEGRIAHGREGGIAVLLRILTERTVFPYAGGVTLPPMREGFAVEQTIGPFMERPALFAKLMLGVSRHSHSSFEMGQLFKHLLDEAASDDERMSILCFGYAACMYQVIMNERVHSRVSRIDPFQVLAALGVEAASFASSTSTSLTQDDAEAAAKAMRVDDKLKGN